MMKKIFPISVFLIPALTLVAGDANAWEYNRNRIGLRLNGTGTIGAMAADGTRDDMDFIRDFTLRGQLNYAVKRGWTTGVVVSTDYLAVDTEHYIKDAFAFVESPWGRVEIGQTDSIITKLGVALPDVGGLRINDYPIIYDEIAPDGTIISNGTISSARYNLRVNAVSIPSNSWQYGMSVAPLSQTFDFAADFAAKYRKPHGKTKVALTLGASFIDNPENMAADYYSARITADWRAQGSVGLNLQYNSWNIGLIARGIYDRNPIGLASDGLSAGAGASYDILKFSVSASYIISYTGVFHDTENFVNHSAILSGRYKFNEWFDVWVSGGAVDTDKIHPFISGGLRARF